MPTASNCAATACAGNAPRRLPRLDPDHQPDGDNHPPADERHPGRHHSERPADMTSESVADIAPEQAADIIGIRTCYHLKPAPQPYYREGLGHLELHRSL